MSLVILGGSFNPVHWGHLFLLEEAMGILGAERACLIPAARSPHKDPITGASDRQRLEMLALATKDDPRLEVLDCEITRGGVSYTIDTLAWLARERPGAEKPYLIIGDDLAAGFSSWRNPEGIAAASRIVLARRTGDPPGNFPWPHIEIDNLSLPISSSLVRQRVREGRPFRHLVPAGVFEYIRSRGLYAA
jgi:nicotinate-nucleotide adenylyltransferase